MDWLRVWGIAMGAAWLSGFRLYASVLTLGLLQHFDADKPGYTDAAQAVLAMSSL